MRRLLRLTQYAQQDLSDASDWYRKKRQGLELEFQAEVFDYLDFICDQPELYAVVFRRVRRTLLNRFPYAIYFLETHDRIIIFGVIHTARDDSAWQARIP
jgi:plasmid stabilization system protein ParE